MRPGGPVEEHRVEIDGRRCIACWECVESCPQTRGTAYPVFEKGEKVPRVVNPGSCLACLTCVENCRALALTVNGLRGLEGSGDPRARSKEERIF